jgi:putative ATP-binding cassette transporter
MGGQRSLHTKGTLDADDSFGAKGSLDTEASCTSQSKRSSDREAVGATGSDESPDTEKPGARDRSSPPDTGNDLDEILEDTQSTDADGVRRRYLLRRFWRSATGFWGKRGNRSAWPLSGAVLLIILIILLNLGTLYAMNPWNRGFFDALDKRNTQQVLELALLYFPLLAASVFLAVMQIYARMTVQRRWRAWLNDHLIGRWLANGRYYQLNLVRGDHENPEFRVGDDVRIATESPVEFATGMI